MKRISAVFFCALCATLTAGARAAISDADAAKLTAKYNCQACHTEDKKLVGPAFKDVAKKFAGDSSAASQLQNAIKNGSTGVWGPMPMPPNNVPPADLNALVEWILALK